ncbi:MAG: glycosyltransferase [Puniceicoccales bacterium]|jgi:glycosyltransferase involved in cell wall biosynthesis|nr:glycosyltransferase [Puniceicoccales bacterium]
MAILEKNGKTIASILSTRHLTTKTTNNSHTLHKLPPTENMSNENLNNEQESPTEPTIIDIFGCCVSIDVFMHPARKERVKQDGIIRVGENAFRQTILSSVQPPLNIDVDESNLYYATNVNKKMLDVLFNKKFFHHRNEEKKYLLLDLTAERYNVLLFDDFIIDKNEVVLDSGFLKEKKYSEKKKIDYIYENPVEYRGAFKKFCDFLQEYYGAENVMVNRTYLVDEYINKEGDVVRFSDDAVRYHHESNIILDWSYEMLINHLPGCTVFEMPAKTCAFENYPWGLSALHYEMSFLDGLYEKICKFVKDRAEQKNAKNEKQNSHPLVTVVTPYLGECSVSCAEIEETVDSILKQTFRNFEWIIVDGGSGNQSVEASSLFSECSKVAAEKRVPLKFLDCELTAGLDVLRNAAIKEASCEFIMFVDFGDVLNPTAIEKFYWHLLTHPELSFVDAWTATPSEGEHHIRRQGFCDGAKFLSENLSHSVVMLRKKIALQVGGYEATQDNACADWLFWIKCASLGFWGTTLEETLSKKIENPRENDLAKTSEAKHFDIGYLSSRRGAMSVARGFNPVLESPPSPRPVGTQPIAAVASLRDELRRRSAFSGVALTKTSEADLLLFKNTLQAKFPNLSETKFPNPTPEQRTPHQLVNLDVPRAKQVRKLKKRLLLIVPHFEMGGSDKWNLDVIKYLDKNWEITLVSTYHDKHTSNCWLERFEEFTSDIHILHQFIPFADYPRYLLWLLQTRDPDVVLITHSQFAYSMLPVLRAYFPQIPFVDYVHIEEEFWRSGAYPLDSVRHSSSLVYTGATSKHLKNWMVERGKLSDKIKTIYINVDVNYWCRASDTNTADELKKRLKIPKKYAIILYICRFVDQKQPDVFVKTAELMLEKIQHCHVLTGLVSDVTFLIAGKGEERYENIIRDLAEKYPKNVRYLGPQTSEEVKSLLHIADISFLPSRSEGISLAFYEAMAMSVVPVGAKVGGQAELVTPECGILIERKRGNRSEQEQKNAEAEQYTSEMLTLLSNPTRLDKMQSAARARIEAHFRIEQMGEQMETLLEDAIKTAKTEVEKGKPALQIEDAKGYASEILEQYRLLHLADYLWGTRQDSPSQSLPAALSEKDTELIRQFRNSSISPKFSKTKRGTLRFLLKHL